jgi:diguanylate cyclase (GGDEF)-like protein
MAIALRRQASTDALTGLYNVRDLRTRLPALLGEAANAGQPLTVLVCDLDNMKPINDTYGHQAGDVVLQAVAEILRTWVPDGGVCWRTGGDEFVAVIPDTPRALAGRLAIVLQDAFRTTSIELPENTVRVSMSIGTATYPEDGETVDALVTAADSRMYESKPGRQTTELAEAV